MIANALNPGDEALLERVKPYTLCGENKLRSLLRLSKYLNQWKIAGDFVECGTYKGGSAAIVSSQLTRDRHLWLYDSFQGMPTTTDKDGTDAQQWIGQCLASVADVEAALAIAGTQPRQYTIRAGWFDQTFQEPLPETVALLHCDADWYDSVRLVLETFYPRIPVGGCVVLDDFGFWEGCREAFYDFCAAHDEKPLIERVDVDQAFWIKGRTHNRDLAT